MKLHAKGSFGAARRAASRGGFTLIELLLVLVILAVLAGVVLTNFSGKSDDARKAAAKTDISNAGTAIDAFDIDMGRRPTSEEGLAALVDAPQGDTKWHGPYLKKALTTDPWGTPYQYANPGSRGKVGYDIWSYGPDKTDGTADDITSWDESK
jgi:general secretion pathway protein G